MGNKNTKAYSTFESFDNEADELCPNDNTADPAEAVAEDEDGIVAEENSLKTLVGKSDEEELDLDDARTIGKKISKMHGDDRKKFIGIVNFMGASCRIYNEIWANYKPVDPSKKKSNKGKEFRGDKEVG
jgi:hypothetical protein